MVRSLPKVLQSFEEEIEMGVRKALWILMKALNGETGSFGAPQDDPIVRKLLNDRDDLTAEEVGYLTGIRFSNFYAFSSQAFDPERLWETVQQTCDKQGEKSDIPAPGSNVPVPAQDRWRYPTTVQPA